LTKNFAQFSAERSPPLEQRNDGLLLLPDGFKDTRLRFLVGVEDQVLYVGLTAPTMRVSP
jgi:hypothetical protein